MESAGRNERAEKALQAEAGLDQGTEERRGLSWGGGVVTVRSGDEFGLSTCCVLSA